MPYYVSQGNDMVQSLGAMWKIFGAVMEDHMHLDGVYIVVDALDECDDSREFLSRHIELNSRPSNSSTTLRLLVTSRPYSNIEGLLQPASWIRLQTENAHENINKDIMSFVSHRISEMKQGSSVYTDRFLKRLQERLETHSEGMFLWASLILEYFQNSVIQDPEETIKSIPTELNKLYNRRIEPKPPRHSGSNTSILDMGSECTTTDEDGRTCLGMHG
jgi:hypothetical protein